MQAFELTTRIDDQGKLQLPRDCKPAFGKQARVIVLAEESERPTSGDSTPTLAQFSGLLKGSPNFNSDPVAIQRELRDERLRQVPASDKDVLKKGNKFVFFALSRPALRPVFDPLSSD